MFLYSRYDQKMQSSYYLCPHYLHSLSLSLSPLQMSVQMRRGPTSSLPSPAKPSLSLEYLGCSVISSTVDQAERINGDSSFSSSFLLLLPQFLRFERV